PPLPAGAVHRTGVSPRRRRHRASGVGRDDRVPELRAHRRAVHRPDLRHLAARVGPARLRRALARRARPPAGAGGAAATGRAIPRGDRIVIRPELVRLSEVKLEGVGKRFGTSWAVRDVSIEVRPGKLYTVLGPPGSGKTTLLRLIAGLAVPDAGHIAV